MKTEEILALELERNELLEALEELLAVQNALPLPDWPALKASEFRDQERAVSLAEKAIKKARG